MNNKYTYLFWLVESINCNPNWDPNDAFFFPEIIKNRNAELVKIKEKIINNLKWKIVHKTNSKKHTWWEDHYFSIECSNFISTPKNKIFNIENEGIYINSFYFLIFKSG